MNKFLEHYPSDCVFVFGERELYDKEPMVKLRRFYGSELSYEADYTPEEALELANILTKIANELIDKKKEPKIRNFPIC